MLHDCGFDCGEPLQNAVQWFYIYYWCTFVAIQLPFVAALCLNGFISFRVMKLASEV